ncbi:unnamed protein product [Dibothriocephalus latus]|uniref:Uncharacterized protein n=1 Tax=Dibothriocephalus latus TaxID=60516 RepID=A0A3P7LSE9_DIBLA|nr:unnamed protein product [Dibothriocephalus latus]
MAYLLHLKEFLVVGDERLLAGLHSHYPYFVPPLPLFQCLFEMLIDYLNDGNMLQSLAKIIKACVRDIQMQQARPRKLSGPAKLISSLSFSVGASSDENRFIALVTHILRAPPNTPVQNADGLVEGVDGAAEDLFHTSASSPRLG